MGKRSLWILRIVLFVALVVMGGWLRLGGMRRPLPMGEEASHLFASAQCIEATVSHDWEGITFTSPSIFHWLVAQSADFMSTASVKIGMPMRVYRLFPLIVGLLALGLIPLLGVRRHGGLFEGGDGALWAMGVTAVSPALVFGSMILSPFSFLHLLFLLFLIVARAYAQWPGYFASIAMGLLFTVALAVDINAAWIIVVLIPTVMVGVGWSRLCLYWQTWHVLTVLVVTGVGVGTLALGGEMGTLSLPMLPIKNLWECVVWWCMGGLGICAWIALAILSGFRSERRWIRFFVILFPACFVGALFFPNGGAFIVPLACLTPIMVAMALGGIGSLWKRGVVGVLTVMMLFGVSYRTILLARVSWGTRAEQRASIRCLKEAVMQTVDQHRRYEVRVITDSPKDALALLSPLRLIKRRVVVAKERIYDDADVLIISEQLIDALPSSVGRKICPGVIAIGEHRFRVFAVKVK